MRRYLVDKILDRQDKYDELVQRERRHTTRRFAPCWILLLLFR